MVNNTNFWDVLSILLALSYVIVLMGGTAYLVEKYSWSPWWFLLTILLVSGLKIKTGS